MLPWIIALAGTVLSGIMSWYFTRRYYLKTARENREMRALIGKLPEEFLTKLKEDKRERLSVKQMNELIESKTIDKNKTGLLAYKACPKCGSSNIEKHTDFEIDEDYKPSEGAALVTGTPYEKIACLDCGWEKDDR